MKKKLVISLSIVFGILAVFLISLWTLFGLSSVSVEFHSTTQNMNLTENEIVEAGQFTKHACVFFESKKKLTKNIESYVSKNEKFAYIRVLNIETKFPNKFVVHVAEREELFAIPHAENFLICDRDLKVLRILDEFSSTNENAILLEGISISNGAVSVGEYLNVTEEGVKNLYSAMLKNNRSFAEQISTFKNIKLTKNLDSTTKKYYFDLKITSFTGKEFVVQNIDFALPEKLQKLFATQSALLSLDVDASGKMKSKDGNVIYLSKLEDGYFVSYNEKYENKEALTYELLESCKIVVGNLTLSEYVNRSTSDIFWALQKKA